MPSSVPHDRLGDTFLDLLKTSTNSLVWPADNIYVGNLLGLVDLQPAQGAQRVDAECICAAEEDAQGVMLFLCPD